MKGNYKYLYILDYSIGKLYEINIENYSEETYGEDILKDYGLRYVECSYMYSYIKLKLESINKIK